jgi:hypothetical protein
MEDKIERIQMIMSMSDTLRDAGSSSIFWFALAFILVLAIVGYFMARRANVSSAPVADGAKVVQDWIPTGRIDFAGPSMDANNADTPAPFYLQAEDIRLLVSFSGIERKEIRWRRATLKEAKRVVFTFHQQMTKTPDGNAEKATPTAPPSDGGEADNIVKIRD